MKRRRAKIEIELKRWLSDAVRVVVAGIGSSIRKDDFVGVEIVKKLRNRVSKSVFLIECETVPESFIETITGFEPTHILILDAAMLNLKPGSLKLLGLEEISIGPVVSTHALSLRVFCEYLMKTTRAKIALLAIQPLNADFGEGLTVELKKTADHVTDLLLKTLP